jgi:hypothetical protein
LLDSRVDWAVDRFRRHLIGATLADLGRPTGPRETVKTSLSSM